MQHRKVHVWNDKRWAQAGIEMSRDINHPPVGKGMQMGAGQSWV